MNEKAIIRNGVGEHYNYSQDYCIIKLSSPKTTWHKAQQISNYFVYYS